MGGKCHEFLLTLKRKNLNVPWGFSLVGGADVNTPLIITKVVFGSPADGVLQRGDIISKVGNYDARDIRHQDAQQLFRNAGDNVRIVVQRDNQVHNTSTGSSRSSSRNYGSPLSVSPHLSPRGVSYHHSPGGAVLTPVYDVPFEEMREGYFSEIPDLKSKQVTNKNLDVHVVNQPYRTTPLVLPGAKVKPDQTVTECYLRHHPNPSVRAHPHHLDAENFLKQKVADSILQRISSDNPTKQIVHKQFNSPIGLYSDTNVADTLQKQTGAQVSRRPVKYDPSKSETLKVLQEQSFGDQVQEVAVPPQSKVYSPNKVIPGKKLNNPAYYQPQQHHHNDFNSMGVPEDDIQQSHSFKRLMWSVLPETDY
ncbi:hypothetical protein FQR65_LT09421 [Abscondita terminalis]|nr:hypothetical protein FQR65_LT09421 [Abscondita terminalis]